MKRLAIILVIFTFSSISFAQVSHADILRKQAIGFMRYRTGEFNRSEIPQEVTNMKAELAAISRTNMNYYHKVYEFRGNDIRIDMMFTMSAFCRVSDVKKPFIKYQITQKDWKTYLEVLVGDDCP
jgi:hypothetical protein